MSGEGPESQEPPPSSGPSAGAPHSPVHAPAHHSGIEFRFFNELKQRNVGRVAILYLVVCWLILEPVHVLFHMLDVPVWANRLVVILMAIGFPGVLLFAWVYESTPEGLKPTAEVDPHRSIRQQTGQRLNRAIVIVLVLAVAYSLTDKFSLSKRVTSQPVESAGPRTGAHASAAPTAAAAFTPPPHSIAVLPFVNMSGDKEQEYFSDGLTEELLNSLAEINGLQVAARTSSFYFKGKDVDLGTIAHRLNVSAVLEGSVRRSSHTIRITAQLIDTVTGFHLWSKTYDRDLGDVLKLQTGIATAVASALKVALLGDVSTKIELGGTRNPGAFDAYLRASKGYQTYHDAESLQAAIATFTEAIRLDPGYALASASRSLALTSYADSYATGPAIRENFDKALADASQTIRLAPELAEGHLALAAFFELAKLDFSEASTEFERALALAPGNVQALSSFGRFAIYMGRTDAGIAASRHAVTLDPLNPLSHFRLGYGLFIARHYAEAVVAFDEVLALDSQDPISHALRGIAYYELGDFKQALASCETDSDAWVSQFCLALAYDKLGRHADADAVLTRLIGSQRDARAYEYAVIYAQREEPLRALEWLDTAVRLRNSRLALLKTDPLMDPLRKEPRFQAIERELKFPPQ